MPTLKIRSRLDFRILEINTYIHAHRLHIALNTKSVRKTRQYLSVSVQDHILFHRVHLKASALGLRLPDDHPWTGANNNLPIKCKFIIYVLLSS